MLPNLLTAWNLASILTNHPTTSLHTDLSCVQSVPRTPTVLRTSTATASRGPACRCAPASAATTRCASLPTTTPSAPASPATRATPTWAAARSQLSRTRACPRPAAPRPSASWTMATPFVRVPAARLATPSSDASQVSSYLTLNYQRPLIYILWSPTVNSTSQDITLLMFRWSQVPW